MPSIIETRQKKLDIQIHAADAFINKNYLMNLSNYEVVPVDPSVNGRNIRLFKVERFTYDEKENINDKLISVYGALQEFHSEIIMIIEGNTTGITFYIGVRPEARRDARTAGDILEKGLYGNFPGTNLTSLNNDEIRDLLEKSTGVYEDSITRHVTSVTTVPAMRNEKQETYVQGIEKFIETMVSNKASECYTAMIIATPLDKLTLERMKRGYEELYSTLSAYSGQSLAYSENDSEAVSEGMYENFSSTINRSITNTTGENSNSTRGTSRGNNSGIGGMGVSGGRQNGSSFGYSSGESWSKSVVEGSASTEGRGTNQSTTNTKGSSKTLTVNYENKSVKNLMIKIEKNLERINACEAFGLWQCASYFISPNVETSIVAANTYRALMAGDDTSVENTYINQWSFQEETKTKEVLKYLSSGLHPKFYTEAMDLVSSQIVIPANLVSGKELPILLGFPQKSVAGLTVIHMASFGRNIFENRKSREKTKIKLGRIKHMGRVQNNDVLLNLDSFTSHCFITGSTGSGKSNTAYKLLDEFLKFPREDDSRSVHFMVIEPAKGEYRKEFANVPGINIFTTNPLYFRMLNINPFKFPNGIHVLEHLDRLIEIFNACWEMTAAMPAILKEAVEQAYTRTGWDLQNSIYRRDGDVHYPTFATVMQTLPAIINQSAYSAENKGNYTGALVTRVQSLTNGIMGQIFEDDQGIDDNVMFDENTIVDLSRVGASETKSLIMGILILKLNEYRMAEAKGSNSGLKHITLMEEAHNILRRCDETSDPVLAKSVEMISNSIAEMRTYGEGFIIVDQSPGAVDVSAIKNTNTKIIMRLPDFNDCMTVGKAAALEDDQIKEISRLGTGEAIVTQNNWIEAVLAQVDEYTGDRRGKDQIADYTTIKNLKGKIFNEYMHQRRLYLKKPERNVYSLKPIYELIDNSDLNRHKSAELKDFWRKIYERESPHYPKTQGGYIEFAQMIIRFLGCQNIFDILPAPRIKIDGTDSIDEKRAREWYAKFKKLLSQYAIFVDGQDVKDIALILIDNKITLSANTSIKSLYTKIFNIVRKGI